MVYVCICTTHSYRPQFGIHTPHQSMCMLASLLYELTLVYPELLQKNNWTEPISTVIKFHHTLVITP